MTTVAAWYSQASEGPLVCAFIFLAACFTDWLDGYLARKWVGSRVCAVYPPLAWTQLLKASMALARTRALRLERFLTQ